MIDSKREIVGGIVLYNPNIKRLDELLSVLCCQVAEVIMVDNGSRNINAICQRYSNQQCHIIRNDNNLGIAKALNQIAAFGLSLGYNWALTLDQDSIPGENTIKEFSKHLNETEVGMLCPRVVDRNFGELSYVRCTEPIEELESCITSSSLLNIKAWEAVGGFCEEYFIDSVDLDMCWLLRENGYKILKINDVILLHEVGHSVVKRFLGKDEIILNHTPTRYYYIVRNSFLFGKRHNQRVHSFLYAVKKTILVLLFEDRRLLKFRYIVKGFKDGILGKYGCIS